MMDDVPFPVRPLNKECLQGCTDRSLQMAETHQAKVRITILHARFEQTFSPRIVHEVQFVGLNVFIRIAVSFTIPGSLKVFDLK